ncbi:hypothetical protein FOA43_002809 [Brettanomyces nanus]|uniref:FAR1 domain-containing protein n=1 Tax=Eeniella nana TaxID=13502 RepID=A0A875S8N5_EENNA|nr:uncharacterized protein FOA43_002809 [Brettanomyces nanus]QPG75454.1 hypothetical protein FOA43_002809 [Brettanomyces nanus]
MSRRVKPGKLEGDVFDNHTSSSHPRQGLTQLPTSSSSPSFDQHPTDPALSELTNLHSITDVPSSGDPDHFANDSMDANVTAAAAAATVVVEYPFPQAAQNIHKQNVTGVEEQQTDSLQYPTAQKHQPHVLLLPQQQQRKESQAQLQAQSQAQSQSELQSHSLQAHPGQQVNSPLDQFNPPSSLKFQQLREPQQQQQQQQQQQHQQQQVSHMPQVVPVPELSQHASSHHQHQNINDKLDSDASAYVLSPSNQSEAYDSTVNGTSESSVDIFPEGMGDPSEYLITPMIEEQMFDNVAVLKEFVKEFGRKNEFGIAIAHSNNKAIYFTCELGGTYREKKIKKSEIQSNDFQTLNSKKIGSKKIRCPFAMVANFSKKRHYWILKITENKHNHPKLNPLLNFPMLRKRSSQVNETIRHMYTSGDKPSVIQQKLRSLYPSLIIKREDIYNEVRILKKKRLVPTHNQMKKQKVKALIDGSSMENGQPLQQTSHQQQQEPHAFQNELHSQPSKLQQQQQQQQALQDQDGIAWSSDPYSNLPDPSKKDVDQQAAATAATAAAVAAVEAFKQGSNVHQRQQNHDQHQESSTQSGQSQQNFLQYQNTDPQCQYNYASVSPHVKDQRFNIDERLLGDN